MLGNMLMQTTFDSIWHRPQRYALYLRRFLPGTSASKESRTYTKELKTKHVDLIDEILKFLETL
jgi:hypothetical protein